jgi:hypothetical protein
MRRRKVRLGILLVVYGQWIRIVLSVFEASDDAFLGSFPKSPKTTEPGPFLNCTQVHLLPA